MFDGGSKIATVCAVVLDVYAGNTGGQGRGREEREVGLLRF